MKATSTKWGLAFEGTGTTFIRNTACKDTLHTNDEINTKRFTFSPVSDVDVQYYFKLKLNSRYLLYHLYVTFGESLQWESFWYMLLVTYWGIFEEIAIISSGS